MKVTFNVFHVLALLVLVICMGCGSEEDGGDDPKDGDANCDNSEIVGFNTLVEGTDSREYILHIPSTYNSDNSTPLLLNFHGFGDCASNFSKNVGGEESRLNEIADANNFIVAYPQGIERTKGDPEWDPGDNGMQNIRENDVYFAEQLISKISSDYNVDLTRVYAAGYSNGGMMAYGLACRKSTLIAAIGVMSGTMLDDTCAPNEYTSAIVFHGIADDVLPYDGNQDYSSTSDDVDFWLDHNGIPETSLVSTELNSGDVIRDVYTGGNEETSVELYTVHEEYGKEGGHVWFTDNIEGNSPNQILWDFLSAFSL